MQYSMSVPKAPHSSSAPSRYSLPPDMSTVIPGSGSASSSKSYGAISVSNELLEKDGSTEEILEEVPPLGVPHEEKRFWWQRAKTYDPDAIATLVCTHFSPSPLTHGTDDSSPAFTTTLTLRRSTNHVLTGRLLQC